MSTNDRNEEFADKNDNDFFDSQGAPDGELSQDELNNVSGGRMLFKAEQPDGAAAAARPSDDPSYRFIPCAFSAGSYSIRTVVLLGQEE